MFLADEISLPAQMEAFLLILVEKTLKFFFLICSVSK